MKSIFTIYSRIVYFICVHYGFAEHHFTISPFHHFTISPFHHFAISPFHHFTISPFHHFTI